MKIQMDNPGRVPDIFNLTEEGFSKYSLLFFAVSASKQAPAKKKIKSKTKFELNKKYATAPAKNNDANAKVKTQ